MIFNNENKTVKIVINTCNCGCGSELRVTRYIDCDVPNNMVEYYLSLHSSKFDEEQQGILSVIAKRIKRAFYNLIGKDYLYMDICMNEREFNEFIEKLKELQK